MNHISARISMATLVLVVVGVLAAAAAPGHRAAPVWADSGGGKAAADFALSVNYGAAFTGNLIRGETWNPHPLCNLCVTYGGPHYVVPDPLGCFYDSNSIGLVSLNDFSGTVTLEVLNLPPGVTSVTAASVSVPRRGAVSTGFKLQAASTAAVGSATVTLRASSGAIVHTVTLPISVADQLPPCQ